MENSPQPSVHPERQSLTLWQVLYGLLGFGLAALIVWAGFNANFLESFGAVMADPWGLVAIADLYLGFLIFALFLFLTDGVRLASFIWIVALCCLGNVVAVAWLVLRLPKLAGRLRQE
ncbi:MAG: DUF1475 family protein [Pseudomonadota bacterium]